MFLSSYIHLTFHVPIFNLLLVLFISLVYDRRIPVVLVRISSSTGSLYPISLIKFIYVQPTCFYYQKVMVKFFYYILIYISFYIIYTKGHKAR